MAVVRVVRVVTVVTVLTVVISVTVVTLFTVVKVVIVVIVVKVFTVVTVVDLAVDCLHAGGEDRVVVLLAEEVHVGAELVLGVVVLGHLQGRERRDITRRTRKTL